MWATTALVVPRSSARSGRPSRPDKLAESVSSAERRGQRSTGRRRGRGVGTGARLTWLRRGVGLTRGGGCPVPAPLRRQRRGSKCPVTQAGRDPLDAPAQAPRTFILGQAQGQNVKRRARPAWTVARVPAIGLSWASPVRSKASWSYEECCIFSTSVGTRPNIGARRRTSRGASSTPSRRLLGRSEKLLLQRVRDCFKLLERGSEVLDDFARQDIR